MKYSFISSVNSVLFWWPARRLPPLFLTLCWLGLIHFLRASSCGIGGLLAGPPPVASSTRVRRRGTWGRGFGVLLASGSNMVSFAYSFSSLAMAATVSTLVALVRRTSPTTSAMEL